MKKMRVLILSMILTVLFMGCSAPETQKSETPVLAKIGDKIITADDFIVSYETGWSILKDVNRAKESYLEAMINERLLSLDTTVSQSVNRESINTQMRLLRQELMVEQLLQQEVYEKITVSDEEIKKAISRNSVKIQTDFLYFNIRELADSARILLDSGVNFQSLADEWSGIPGVLIEYASTGFNEYDDLPAELNHRLFSLQKGEISPVIAYNNGYFIFRIADMRRSVIGPEEYQDRFHHYHTKVLMRKKLENGKKYIKEFMDAKAVVVDGKMFNMLVNNIYPLFENSNLEETARIEPDSDIYTQINHSIQNEVEQVMVKFSDGAWTVNDLLYHLSYRPVQTDFENINAFARYLREIIGVTIRDVMLEKEALSRGYLKKPEVIAEMENWRTNFLVQNYITNLQTEVTVDESEIEDYYQSLHTTVPKDKILETIESGARQRKINQILTQKTDSLKKEIPVTIDREMLEKIEVIEPTKGRLPNMKIYKPGLTYFRTIAPVPNAVWGL